MLLKLGLQLEQQLNTRNYSALLSIDISRKIELVSHFELDFIKTL